MIDFKRYIPSELDEPFLAKTKNGYKTAVRINRVNVWFLQWVFINDENLQLSLCNPFEIEEWEYLDKCKMEALLFEENQIQKIVRQVEANEVLKQVFSKKPTRNKFKIIGLVLFVALLLVSCSSI